MDLAFFWTTAGGLSGLCLIAWTWGAMTSRWDVSIASVAMFCFIVGVGLHVAALNAWVQFDQGADLMPWGNLPDATYAAPYVLGWLLLGLAGFLYRLRLDNQAIESDDARQQPGSVAYDQEVADQPPL